MVLSKLERNAINVRQLVHRPKYRTILVSATIHPQYEEIRARRAVLRSMTPQAALRLITPSSRYECSLSPVSVIIMSLLIFLFAFV
jgi:hypothetical protein